MGPPLFDVGQPTKVIVVLGASVSRPLEVFELRFPAAAAPSMPPDGMLSGNGSNCGEFARVYLRKYSCMPPDGLLSSNDSKCSELRCSHVAVKVKQSDLSAFVLKLRTMGAYLGEHVATL